VQNIGIDVINIIWFGRGVYLMKYNEQYFPWLFINCNFGAIACTAPDLCLHYMNTGATSEHAHCKQEHICPLLLTTVSANFHN